MTPISPAEHKQILLAMLVNIDEVCQRYGLRYSLGGGTLLGAIRHKGFIPWDDDVDIMMPRPDYNEFIRCFNSSTSNTDLYCESFEYNKNFWLPFAKVFHAKTIMQEKSRSQPTSVFVDIFPIDGYPTEVEARRSYIKKMYYLQRLRYVKSVDFVWNKKRWKRCLVKLMLSVVPQRLLTGLVIHHAKSCDFKTSTFIGATTGRYGALECYRRYVFEDFVDTEFEGHQLKIIKEFDVYLRQHYGNYMKLPPRNKQKSGHTVLVGWK